MKAEEFDALFGADNISPDEQRIRGGATEEPVYVPGGRYESLAALKEHNQSAYVGQIGGRRSRRAKRRVNKKRRTVRRCAYRRC